MSTKICTNISVASQGKMQILNQKQRKATKGPEAKAHSQPNSVMQHNRIQMENPV